ncbi:hypothetical protein J2T57_001542 [Natronocella acetinitrilica]|uniref:ATP-binding protein n=1 Tax=Natronocella acetinitrilica TaxID=414046 RepID=A0AAE3G261_9GAMM|nr:ATP-binding protein [Natronocella acetinitrilica]MCP1674440.1 hypothetical protein [Natronocella acetinitrilica]
MHDDNAAGEMSAATNPLGICRVVLLDSYLPRTASELTIDGHLSITGRNSTGKTSLLRLLPLFFGAEPRRLVRPGREGGLLSFAHYYLPRAGSAIVFGYRTQRGEQMAVFIPNPRQEGLRALLIAGAYDPALFIAPDDSFLPSEELAARARAEGRLVEPCTSYTAYRNLVFGSARERGRTEAARQFNVLHGTGALSGQSLGNIHTILTATLHNHIDERLLRRLLFEQAASANPAHSEDALSRINLDPELLRRWVGNHAGLTTLLSLRESARTTLESADALRTAAQDVAIHRAAAERRLAQSGEQLARAEKTITTQIALIGEIDGKYQLAQKAHEQARGAANDNKSAAESRIRGFRLSEQRLVERGIEDARAIAPSLADRRQAEEAAGNRLQLLKSENADIETALRAQCDAAQAHCAEQQRALRDEREQADAKAQQRRVALRERDRAALAALRERQREARSALAERLERANGQRADARANVRVADADAALIEAHQAMLSQQVALGRDIQEAQSRVNDAGRSHREAVERHQAEQAAQDARLAERRRKEEARNDLTEQLERRGTLLHFVREHAPQAEAQMSAVLSQGTALLLSETLSPARASSIESSLYGIEIDLSRLAPASSVDADLREALEQVTQRLEALRGELESGERAIADAERAARALAKAKSEADLALSRLRSQERALGDAERAKREEIEGSREAAVRAAKEAHAAADEAWQRADADLKEMIEAQRLEEETLVGDHDADGVALEAEISKALSVLSARAGALERARDEQVAAAEAAADKKRSERGVDERILLDAAEAVRLATAARKEAQEAKLLVEEWDMLQKQIDEERPGLEDTVQRLAAEIQALDRDWRAAAESLAERKSAAERMLQQARQEKESAEAAIGPLETLLAMPVTLEVDEVPEVQSVSLRAGLPIADLIASARRAGQAVAEGSQALRKHLAGFQRNFTRTQSAFLREFAASEGYADHAGSSEAAELLQAAGSIERLFGAADEIDPGARHLPDGSHGAKLEAIVAEFLVHQFELDGFVEGLEAVSREVRRQAATIQSAYRRLLSAIESVDAVEIEAAFDLSAIDGYHAAKRMSTALRAYAEERDRAGDTLLLPSEQLVTCTEALANYLAGHAHRRRNELWEAVQLAFTVTRMGGRERKHCRHGDTLVAAFSSGIGMLVAVTVLVGFLENQRRDAPIAVPWMLDELLALDEENIRQLLAAMEQERIYLMTTSPDVPAEVDPCFRRRYVLQSENARGERLAAPIFIESAPRAQAGDPFDVLDAGDTEALAVDGAHQEGSHHA